MTATRKKRRPNRRKSYKAQPIREVTLATAPWAEWDKGSAGAANRDRLVSEDAVEFDHATGRPKKNVNGVRRMRRETWVEIYFKQGKLTKPQAAAAERLYAAYAGHVARDPIAALESTVDGGKCDEPMVTRLDRQRLFWALWRAVPTRCRPVIEHVVLDDRSLRSMTGCANGARELVYMKRLVDGLEALT
jgi:hypothetical protein